MIDATRLKVDTQGIDLLSRLSYPWMMGDWDEKLKRDYGFNTVERRDSFELIHFIYVGPNEQEIWDD